MHASMERLHRISGRFTKEQIAIDMDCDPLTLTKWSTRGVSEKGAKLAADTYGLSDVYILTGNLPAGMASINQMLELLPNKLGEASDIHPSMGRLHKVSGLIKRSDIADALGFSKGSVTNWATKGVSDKGAIEAATIYGVDARYILEGTLPAGATEQDLTNNFTKALSIAQEQTAGSLDRLKKVSGRRLRDDIAKDLEVSPTTISNWAAMGVSKKGCTDAAEIYGGDAEYIRTGNLPDGIESFEVMMGLFPSKTGFNPISDDDSDGDDYNDKQVHKSLRRLITVSGKTKKSDIAKDLGVSAATMNNWAVRGVSREGALSASLLYDANANYILSGITATVSNGDQRQAQAQIPVMTSVSINSNGVLVFIESKERADKPSSLSSSGFALEVSEPNMMPEFNVRDLVFIETETEVTALKHLDYLLVQHKDGGGCTLKQVMYGGRRSDAYLINLNTGINGEVLPFSDFDMIGKVVMKSVTYY